MPGGTGYGQRPAAGRSALSGRARRSASATLAESFSQPTAVATASSRSASPALALISAVPCLASDRTLSLTARASRSRVPCSRTSARRNMRPIWARHVAPRPVIVEPYTWCLTAPTQTAPRRRRFHHPVDRASPCRDAWRHQPASLPLTIALNFAGYFAIGARPSYLPSPIAFALALRPQAVARNLGAYFHTLGRNQMRAIWILQPVNRTHLQCALPYWSSP